MSHPLRARRSVDRSLPRWTCACRRTRRSRRRRAARRRGSRAARAVRTISAAEAVGRARVDAQLAPRRRLRSPVRNRCSSNTTPYSLSLRPGRSDRFRRSSHVGAAPGFESSFRAERRAADGEVTRRVQGTLPSTKCTHAARDVVGRRASSSRLDVGRGWRGCGRSVPARRRGVAATGRCGPWRASRKRSTRRSASNRVRELVARRPLSRFMRNVDEVRRLDSRRLGWSRGRRRAARVDHGDPRKYPSGASPGWASSGGHP
jgi:hypothetical protein